MSFAATTSLPYHKVIRHLHYSSIKNVNCVKTQQNSLSNAALMSWRNLFPRHIVGNFLNDTNITKHIRDDLLLGNICFNTSFCTMDINKT